MLIQNTLVVLLMGQRCQSMLRIINRLLMPLEKNIHTEVVQFPLNGYRKSKTMFVRSAWFLNKTMRESTQTAFMSVLAIEVNAPVRAITHHDPNITSRVESTADQAFREAIGFRWKGLQIQIRCNSSFVAVESKANFNLGVWSINYPDRIMMTKQPPSGPTMVGRWPLFVTGSLSLQANTVWTSQSFLKLLNSLSLSKNESLHFYRNAVTFYTEVSEAHVFMQRLEVLLDFLSRRAAGAESEEAVRLPASFLDLEDIAQTWAISDDISRSERVEASSIEELYKLVECVMPRVNAINEYLSVHFDEESGALGLLAEAVSEAKLRLDQLL